MRAVLFDMDGTTLDTLEDLRNAVNFVMRRYGYPERTHEEMLGFVGNGVRRMLAAALPEGVECTDGQYGDCCAEYERHMDDRTQSYPGICTLMEALHAEGFKVGIVSNKYDSAARRLAEAHFADRIDGCTGTFPDLPPKPAPDTALRLLAQWGVSPEDTVYVGDSGVDMATAQNLGVPFIGVSWGFWGGKRLAEAGAQCICDNAEQVLCAIERIFA